MSNQCQNCGRDVNNNYTSYANAYQTTTANTKIDNKSSNAVTSTSKATSGSNNKSAAVNSTQITAKVMFGSVGAIKELREKEQAEKNNAARTARRQ